MNEENETRADYRRRVNNQPESGTNGAGTGGNGRNPHPPYYRGSKKWFKWVKRIIFLILLLIVAGGPMNTTKSIAPLRMSSLAGAGRSQRS